MRALVDTMLTWQAARVARCNDPEEAAARALQRVLGGTWEIHDTGERSAMFDVLHVLDDGERVALEVTSEGSFDSVTARKAIDRRVATGVFAGESLANQWHVSIDRATQVSKLRPAAIEKALHDFERRGSRGGELARSAPAVRRP